MILRGPRKKDKKYVEWEQHFKRQNDSEPINNEIRDVEWVMMFMTPHDYVKYLLPGLDKPISMPYNKFIGWVHRQFYIKDFKAFKKSLNSFETILLNNKTGKIDIIKVEDPTLSYGELLGKKIEQQEGKGEDKIYDSKSFMGNVDSFLTKFREKLGVKRR